MLLRFLSSSNLINFTNLFVIGRKNWYLFCNELFLSIPLPAPPSTSTFFHLKFSHISSLYFCYLSHFIVTVCSSPFCFISPACAVLTHVFYVLPSSQKMTALVLILHAIVILNSHWLFIYLMCVCVCVCLCVYIAGCGVQDPSIRPRVYVPIQKRRLTDRLTDRHGHWLADSLTTSLIGLDNVIKWLTWYVSAWPTLL